MNSTGAISSGIRNASDIRATLKKYHDKGLHICAWINPYIAQGTAFFKEVQQTAISFREQTAEAYGRPITGRLVWVW